MREVKFRAWNIEEKIMCYDNEDNSECYWDGVIASNVGLINSQLNNSRFYQYMQYTGLKDKNGVEIYEGDIYRKCYFSDMWKKNMEVVQVVEWNQRDTSFGLWKEDVNRIEVIGNIYENPERLKEEI